MRYSGINIGRLNHDTIDSFPVGEVDEFFKGNKITLEKSLPNGILYYEHIDKWRIKQICCKIPEHNPLFNYCLLESALIFSRSPDLNDIYIEYKPILYKQLEQMIEPLSFVKRGYTK